ncbi:MAG: HEAT repeat domain-containing protein [Planctomycetes bacterium]|nr:HEAT repeat domain-containing protein [Planctomycetota bacterium]
MTHGSTVVLGLAAVLALFEVGAGGEEGIGQMSQTWPALGISRTFSQPPALDGSLAGWGEAPCVSLVALDGTLPQEAETEVRVGYDRRNLYVHFTCIEPAVDNLVAKAGARDDDLLGDDLVEVFIAPEGVKGFEKIPASTGRGHKTFLAPVCGERRYWHLSLNCRGVRGDAENELRVNPANRTFDTWFGQAWDPEWTAKTKVGKDRWIAVMAIPFEALGRGAPGSPEGWRANFCRIRRTRGPAQYSAWSPGGDGFHDTSCYGDLVFAGPSSKSARQHRQDAERLTRLAAFVRVERIALASYERDEEFPPVKSFEALAQAARSFLDELGEGDFTDGAQCLLAAATRNTAKLAEVIRKYPASEWADDAAANLGKNAPANLIDELGQRLSSPDALVRANAVRALMQFALAGHTDRAKYVEEVVELIADPDPFVRIEAAYMVNTVFSSGRFMFHGRDEEKYYGRPESEWRKHTRMRTGTETRAVGMLIANVNNSNIGVRTASIWGLRNMADESALASLRALFRDQGQSGFVRSKCIEAMGVIIQAVRREKGDSALDARLEREYGPTFAKVWQDVDADAAGYGMTYFPFFREKYVPDLLQAAVKARDGYTRYRALRKLVSFTKRGALTRKDAAAVAPVVNAVLREDSYALARRFAALLAGSLDLEDASEALSAAASSDTDASVRKAARDALSALGEAEKQ